MLDGMRPGGKSDARVPDVHRRHLPSTIRRLLSGLTRMTRLHVLCAVGVSAALAGIVLPSCSAVVGVDGYQDATEELCNLLERCFGGKLNDCVGHVRTRVVAASD